MQNNLVVTQPPTNPPTDPPTEPPTNEPPTEVPTQNPITTTTASCKYYNVPFVIKKIIFELFSAFMKSRITGA